MHGKNEENAVIFCPSDFSLSSLVPLCCWLFFLANLIFQKEFSIENDTTDVARIASLKEGKQEKKLKSQWTRE
jgi:hypothetical protein